MSRYRRYALAAALFAASALVHADPRTVCTITVNSPDEREVFRRYLPGDDYRFVELVERGRPDWLASACRAGVRCDVLLISGHFDGGTEFYSDKVDARESLPVAEMERAACSDSCPGVFSQLKEVYLFGCNTLNAEALRSATGEVGRSLQRAGYSLADADRVTKMLNEQHGDSNRDRMREIFKDVPVIYGFSSKAPLGASAGPVLERYFQGGGASEIATGHPSPKLLALFAPVSMTSTTGLHDADPQAAHRRDVCEFADDRLSTADKLGFLHTLLARDMAEVRMFLDHIERYIASLAAGDRSAPTAAAALEAIAHDGAARSRYLEFARDADQASVRTRMIDVALRLGWLTPAQRRDELIRVLDDRIASRNVGSDDVDLACTLNRDGELTGLRGRVKVPAREGERIGPAAILACLGSPTAHARVLRALSSANDGDVALAQVYLHHRPIADVHELRLVASGVAGMTASSAQVRALDTLAHQRVADRESIESLTRLYPQAKSLDVQRAIAGVLIRADYRELARPELVKVLRDHRIKSPDGQDLIDVLIRRLQMPS
jgi:hypothetical protein